MKHNYLCRINKNFTLIYRINGGPTTNLYNSSLLSSSPFNSIAQSSERERERDDEGEAEDRSTEAKCREESED